MMIAATMAIARAAIGETLVRFASRAADGRFEAVVVAGSLALVGAGFAAALYIASLLSRRPRLRAIPIAFAIIAMVGDQLYLRDDYAGMHCIVAWGAAMVGGVGLAPLAERTAHNLFRSRGGRGVLLASALFALFGLAWPPPNEARFELFRQPCAVAPWVLATTLWRTPPLHAPVQLPSSPWIEDRIERTRFPSGRSVTSGGSPRPPHRAPSPGARPRRRPHHGRCPPRRRPDRPRERRALSNVCPIEARRCRLRARLRPRFADRPITEHALLRSLLLGAAMDGPRRRRDALPLPGGRSSPPLSPAAVRSWRHDRERRGALPPCGRALVSPEAFKRRAR